MDALAGLAIPIQPDNYSGSYESVYLAYYNVSVLGTHEGLMRILTKRIIQPGGTDGQSRVVSGVNSTSPLPSKEKPPSGKCSN